MRYIIANTIFFLLVFIGSIHLHELSHGLVFEEFGELEKVSFLYTTGSCYEKYQESCESAHLMIEIITYALLPIYIILYASTFIILMKLDKKKKVEKYE